MLTARALTVVTCDPNELIAPVYPQTMIATLVAEDQERWLACLCEDVVKLQCPFPAERMTVHGPEFPTREKA